MICPERLKPVGIISVARLSSTPPPFVRKRRYTGRRAEGIRYERKVQAHLMYEFPDTYVPSPWLHFREEGATKFRWCQPDGLIVDTVRGIITCCEIKYSHTSDAWWQTRKLYMPVLAFLFPAPRWDIQVCEIVRWYDAAVAFPEPIELASEPSRPSKKFKVHICHP